jgi:hypothetical protein
LAKTGQRTRTKGQRIAFFCVPIKLEGKTIGTISVDRKVHTGGTVGDEFCVARSRLEVWRR